MPFFLIADAENGALSPVQTDTDELADRAEGEHQQATRGKKKKQPGSSPSRDKNK